MEIMYCTECEERVYRINWVRHTYNSKNLYKQQKTKVFLGFYCKKCKRFSGTDGIKIGTEEKFITRG